MSKNKKIIMMLAKGGASQADIAAALHVGKRDVSAAAKAMHEHGLEQSITGIARAILHIARGFGVDLPHTRHW